MKHKIQTLLTQLNHGLVEREDTLKTALLTVLAGENLVLIGPPGTGKSLIARRIADSFAHDGHHGYFEYLLTKFSTPEEIFGPLSITELKADRFKRNTAGYLPTVKIAFLDEIFKASSSILNALLTILNERIYHNGAEPQKVPMQALIAASNELPNDQEELSALYDRFLVRGFVDYVSQDNLLRLFENTGSMPELTQLTAANLKNIQTAAEAVTIPPEIMQAMQRIWIQHKETFKEDRREILSDRRLKKVIKLLCVSAATNGRTEVDLSDVFLLKNCLWNHQDNALKVRDLILNTLRSFSRPVPQSQDMQLYANDNELPTYEVAKDGKTLVPAQPQTTVFSTSSALVQASAKVGTVVKGFKGSGTQQDPLLIQTVEDLMDLSRPEVGLQGYYFRQTNDIDCSVLSSWTDISFNGHYDGEGCTIAYKSNKDGKSCNLFIIINQSSIKNLKLHNLNLTFSAEYSNIENCLSSNSLIVNKAKSCTITACESNGALICGSGIDCSITACKAGSSLIDKHAENCTITSCKSGSALISGDVKNCKIKDCLVVLNTILSGPSTSYGGVAGYGSLGDGGLVERCFVTGSIKRLIKTNIYFNLDGSITRIISPAITKADNDQRDFYGIASSHCSKSFIRQCALGKIEMNSEVKIILKNRISNYDSPSRLENNASIDSNPGMDNINGKDGKTVAAALFKQRYFEHTLGWDFDTVWKWDDKEDRPELRSVGVGAAVQQAKPAAQQTSMTDLLTQQMRANIWL